MCVSASSNLRVYPWQGSHRGWASWPASGFILTLTTGRGESQPLGLEARAVLRYHLQIPGTPRLALILLAQKSSDGKPGAEGPHSHSG